MPEGGGNPARNCRVIGCSDPVVDGTTIRATGEALRMPVPVSPIPEPLASGPTFGLAPVTVGQPPPKVIWSPGGLSAEVPMPVVTLTSTVPVPAGTTT